MAKAGVKSSEFWLSAIAALVGGVLASGVVSNALALQLLGGIGTFLATIGYSTSRAWVKSNEAKAEAIKAAVEKKS
jgi:hypothetical protein